jgi:hypothetical protein
MGQHMGLVEESVLRNCRSLDTAMNSNLDLVAS